MGKPTGFMEYQRKTGNTVAPLERIKNFKEFHLQLPKKEQQMQAARCMACGVPFCQAGTMIAGMASGCPLQNLVPEWNDLVYLGNYEQAYRRLTKTNCFPEFTSRVCPALCEAACTCNVNGDPVCTKENERAIIENAWATGLITPQPPKVRTGKRVAVVGSGPSGLAAAMQLNRRGHSVTVFERRDRVGGLLRYGIPNMKLDKSVIDRRVDLMKAEGIEFVTNADIGKDVKADKLLKEFDRVLLCCGAAAAGCLLTPWILRATAVPSSIFEITGVYLRITFLGAPFTFFYNALAAGLKSVGDSKTPLYFLILTSALNIGLDLLFIVPFKMGILGAALATDISQAISGVVSFGFLCRKFEVLHMQKGELAFSKRACIRLMGIGVPMGLQCSITAIGSVIMQWAVNVLGSTAVAAVTAAGKTQSLLTVPMESVGTAMATYAGQNLGASRMDRVRQGVNSAMLIILIYGVASAFVLHFTDVQIMGLFLDTAKEVDIVAMGREYLFWNSVFFVPLGALIVWRYSIQGLGFSSLAMLAGVAEMVARTAVAIVLVPILGYFGAELSNPAAWIAACLFLYPAYRWTCRQLDNRLLTARLHIQGDHAETVL